MSSFIGHSITGVFVHSRNTDGKSFPWFLWLVFLAISPDLEYVPAWLSGVRHHTRFTHSIVFCSILPVLTVLYFKLFPREHRNLKAAVQAFAASYSHIVLDMLTGVSQLPLLWPFTDACFRLPFGILPSAGRLDPSNIYLYRNLLIELGILLPFFSLCRMKGRPTLPGNRVPAALSMAVLILFAVWGISLSR